MKYIKVTSENIENEDMNDKALPIHILLSRCAAHRFLLCVWTYNRNHSAYASINTMTNRIT